MEVTAPRWDGRSPWVETWYGLLRPADAAWALWFRYQLLAPQGAPARTSVWGTAFAATPHAARADAVAGPPSAGPALLVSPHGSLEADRAHGAVPGLRWDLTWAEAQPPTSVLPFAWMRRGPFPRMKVATPVPAARAAGTVQIGEDHHSADGATLTLGHTWGTAHAHRWAWMQAPLPHGAVEAVAAVPFRGAPVLTAARLQWRGRDYRLAGGRTLLAADSAWEPVRWRLSARGQGAALEFEAAGPDPDVVVLEYRDPRGGARYCHAADRAMADLRLRLPGEEVRLRVAASLEVGWPEPEPRLAPALRRYEAAQSGP